MATNTIGSSTLAHRIHTNVNTDNLSSNKEYMDNQEDAILSYMEETKGETKGETKDTYKPIIITHIERKDDKVTITRLDNGRGMDNVDVFIDASNSTTKKEKIGHFHQGMFNSTFSLKADTDIIVSRGSKLKANSLKLYPKKMVEKVEEGLKKDEMFNSLDTYLTNYLIVKNSDGKDIPTDKRIKWDKLLTKTGTLINKEILKIKDGSRGTIQQQIWEENCPITPESMEKYNNSLKYKRKEFTPTYIFNNEKFEIKTKCYFPKKYNVLKFPIKIKYNGNKGKLYIKVKDDEFLFCNKSDTSLILINKEELKDVKFDDKITIKLALISVEDAKIQQKDLQLSAIYDLKVPVIETKRCILGISRTIFDKRLMTHHLFKASGQVNPRLSFCIEDNHKYKKFGVTSNKDIPNLENPEDKMVKKLLLNFVEPLYKYLIKKYAHGKIDLKDKHFGEFGITNKNDWKLDEMVDFITLQKTKKKTPLPPPPPPPPPKRENISTMRKEHLWKQQFKNVFEVRCICEKFMTPFTANMGHIIAHSNGGGCTDDNLFWICKKCNGNDTTPIYEMIEKNYGKEHKFYKKLINDFNRLGKKYK